MPTDFPVMADEITSALLDPVTARDAGSHDCDSQLMDYSASAVAHQVAVLHDASHALSEVDTDELTVSGRVDHAMLTSAVDARLFALTETRDHEWDPLLHNPGQLLDALISRDSAPVEERLGHLVDRLAAVPDAMATARAVLTDVPAVHARVAADQFTGVAALLRDRVPGMVDAVPGMRDRVEPVRAAAVSALSGFADWLSARAAEPGRDPRLGRRLWEAKLWHTLDTPLTAVDVDRRAWVALEEAVDRLRETAAALTGGRADDDAVRAAFAAAADRPQPAGRVDFAATALSEAAAFVEQFELVTLPDDPVEVRQMPAHMRGVAGAYCDAPGPLESSRIPTLFAVSGPPEHWPARRRESFYREYNDDMMRNLTVHEAMPGHHLQLAHARRFNGSTRVRSVFSSGTFVEGWAVYAEELMADHAFGGLRVRLQQLKMRVRCILNAILDQAVHCDTMSREDAMAMLTQRGFQEEGEAAGKWQRALLTSTQLCTYFVGCTEIAAIAAARPVDADIRDWHDRMLAHGSPSPRHLPALLSGGLPA